MGKYVSGISLCDMFRMEKDELKGILAKGNVSEEGKKQIVEIFEDAVYWAIEGCVGSRTLEKIFLDKNEKPELLEYMAASQSIRKEFDYEYDNDVDEDY